jgi:hypothetical protein
VRVRVLFSLITTLIMCVVGLPGGSSPGRWARVVARKASASMTVVPVRPPPGRQGTVALDIADEPVPRVSEPSWNASWRIDT